MSTKAARKETKRLFMAIDGVWSASQFGDILSSVAWINVYLRGDIPGTSDPILLATRPWLSQTEDRLSPSRDALRVKSIQFGSPGVIELLGSAAVISALIVFINNLISLHVGAEGRRLQNENLKAQTRLTEINTRIAYEELARHRVGRQKDERMETLMVLGEPLVEAINDRRIRDVSPSRRGFEGEDSG